MYLMLQYKSVLGKIKMLHSWKKTKVPYYTPTSP